MEKMTFLDLAFLVLKKQQTPLTAGEIWQAAQQSGWAGDVQSHGKTPQKTMAARLYTDAQKPDSRFVKIGTSPARFLRRNAIASDWQNQELPDEHATLSLDLAYSADEMQRIRLGFIPSAMEEKWFIYFDRDILYLHRSWTGICVFRVHFAPEGDGWRATHAEANRDARQYGGTNDTEDRGLIEDIIRGYLLTSDYHHGDTFVVALQNAMQPGYLGNPEVVSGALQPFFETVVGKMRHLYDKTAEPVTFADEVQANLKLTAIFCGQNPDYAILPGWHTVDALGQAVIRHFNLNAEYCADESLDFIVGEGFAALSSKLSQMIRDCVYDPNARWDDALPQLNEVHRFAVAVLMGTQDVFMPGKTLDDFRWQPVQPKPKPARKQTQSTVAEETPKPGPNRHPRLDEHGQPVRLKVPSTPTPLSAWHDPERIATVIPDGPMPASLNGMDFTPWTDHPRTTGGWEYVDGINEDLDEPPLSHVPGYKEASGCIIEEPDGRVWVVHPSNGWAGYQVTFPKGGHEKGLSLQANAIREAFEESGLQVAITGLLGDFDRSTTRARYYIARRIGGTPAAMGWESQAVSLVPKAKLYGLLNGAKDKPIALALGALPPAPDDAEPIDDWEQIGKQAGSNPGGLYEDGEGDRWYCKFPKTTDHARNEVLAAKLYEAVDVRVPETRLISCKGGIGVASRYIPRLEADPEALKDGAVDGVADGFAVDCWLANWDSVGLVYDNMLVDDGGQAVRLDPGGALLFRAQGAPKGEAFGDEVGELQTLRSSLNPEAQSVFGPLEREEILEGARRVVALPDERIKGLVFRYGPGNDPQRKALAEKLIRRRDDLARKLGL